MLPFDGGVCVKLAQVTILPLAVWFQMLMNVWIQPRVSVGTVSTLQAAIPVIVHPILS